MAQENIATLRAQAQEIRDETVAGANTANRVGTMHVNTVDSFALKYDYSYALHVDLDNGNDSNSGTDSEPYLTIEAAWARRLTIGNSTHVYIHIHGENDFPSSLTLDGTSGGSSNMYTYLLGDSRSSNKYEYGPATINLVNSGIVMFAGVGFYNPGGVGLTIQSDIYQVSAHFKDVYIDGSLSVVGTPTVESRITLNGTFWRLQGFSGDGSNLRLDILSGAFIRFFNSATFNKIWHYSGGIQVESGQTLTASTEFVLFPSGSISLIGTATLAGGTLSEYGGSIASSLTSTISIARTGNTRLNASRINFASGTSGMSSDDVEAGILENWNNRGVPVTAYRRYVAAITGSDVTGDGSRSAPYQTINHALIELRILAGDGYGLVLTILEPINEDTFVIGSEFDTLPVISI